MQTYHGVQTHRQSWKRTGAVFSNYRDTSNGTEGTYYLTVTNRTVLITMIIVISRVTMTKKCSISLSR